MKFQGIGYKLGQAPSAEPWSPPELSSSRMCLGARSMRSSANTYQKPNPNSSLPSTKARIQTFPKRPFASKREMVKKQPQPLPFVPLYKSSFKSSIKSVKPTMNHLTKLPPIKPNIKKVLPKSIIHSVAPAAEVKYTAQFERLQSPEYLSITYEPLKPELEDSEIKILNAPYSSVNPNPILHDGAEQKLMKQDQEEEEEHEQYRLWEGQNDSDYEESNSECKSQTQEIRFVLKFTDSKRIPITLDPEAPISRLWEAASENDVQKQDFYSLYSYCIGQEMEDGSQKVVATHDMLSAWDHRTIRDIGLDGATLHIS